MGATFWLQTWENSGAVLDSDDFSLIYRHVETLDALCAAAQVQPLSDFVDTTDWQHAFGDADEDALEDLPDIGYAVSDMSWYPARAGLITLQAVYQAINLCTPIERLADNAVDPADVAALCEELADAITRLVPCAARDGRFHWALIG